MGSRFLANARVAIVFGAMLGLISLAHVSGAPRQSPAIISNGPDTGWRGTISLAPQSGSTTEIEPSRPAMALPPDPPPPPQPLPDQSTPPRQGRPPDQAPPLLPGPPSGVWTKEVIGSSPVITRLPDTDRTGEVSPRDPSSAARSASSAFANDAEGWTGGSFPDNGPYDTVIARAPVRWNQSAGRAGGAISMTDPGPGNFFFEAPAPLTGNKQMFYGGELRYDLRSEGGELFDEADVILLSPGLVLVYRVPSRPTSTWASVSVPFIESAWKVDRPAGRAPTRDEFVRALSSISALRIRGEYRNGPETGWLGNVSLMPQSGSTSGIERGRSPAPQPQRALTGTWQGTWRNSRGESGSWPMNLVETDGVITGTDDGITILDGRRVGDTMTWRIELDGGKRRWTVTVTISPDGQTLSVTYNANDTRGPYSGGGELRRR